MSPSSTDDDIHYPPGFGLSDVVGWGTTGLVVLDRSSKTIIKTPLDPGSEDCLHRIQREQQIYERLHERGGHKGILSYKGTFGPGIRLEYAPNYNLRAYNNEHNVGFAQKLRWAIQIAEAISFIHRAGIIHGDLTCANIFLDEELDAKLADFAGSSIDGSQLLVLVTENHAFPGSLLSVRADLFAFGSVLYEIITGHAPYEGLDETEIQARYSKGEFPNTESLQAIGAVISKCWHGDYCETETIVYELKGISPEFSLTVLDINMKQHKKAKPWSPRGSMALISRYPF